MISSGRVGVEEFEEEENPTMVFFPRFEMQNSVRNGHTIGEHFVPTFLALTLFPILTVGLERSKPMICLAGKVANNENEMA